MIDDVFTNLHREGAVLNTPQLDSSLPFPCVYLRGSTNPVTMQNELPVWCQERGCNGYDPKCDAYYPNKKVEEK